VLFAITSMPVGGAETLLVSLIRHLDRERFLPEICCLKGPGPLGEAIATEVPVHSQLSRGKYDVSVLARLRKLVAERRIDAVVTVGAGDKMFWGRLAAWLEGVPVILSALHSTGWPDSIGRLNRWLTSVTDGFIAVADRHGRYLVEQERLPARKVRVIPNGVDTERFRPAVEEGLAIRQQLGIPTTAPVCGIVAALRPEKNHLLFLRAAALVSRLRPDAHFLIVGDGPEREKLERTVRDANLGRRVHFLGSRADIPQVLPAMDVLALTSHNEALPVSILEAMACQIPVVATRVGSVAESVRHSETGFLVAPGDAEAMADHWRCLFDDTAKARRLGVTARQWVQNRWSLDHMVAGYQDLILEIYSGKCPGRLRANLSPVAPTYS